jgi:hypothetical protein
MKVAARLTGRLAKLVLLDLILPSPGATTADFLPIAVFHAQDARYCVLALALVGGVVTFTTVTRTPRLRALTATADTPGKLRGGQHSFRANWHTAQGSL